MKQVQFSVGKDSEWSNRFRQACEACSIVWSDKAKIRQGEEAEGTELNGVEEREKEKKKTECQMKKKMESKVKESWHRQTGG